MICRPSVRTSQSSIIAHGSLFPYRRIEPDRPGQTSPFISSCQSNAYISILCVHQHLMRTSTSYAYICICFPQSVIPSVDSERHVVCHPSLRPQQSCIVALVPCSHIAVNEPYSGRTPPCISSCRSNAYISICLPHTPIPYWNLKTCGMPSFIATAAELHNCVGSSSPYRRKETYRTGVSP